MVKAVGQLNVLVLYASGRQYVYEFDTLVRIMRALDEYSKEELGNLRLDMLKAACESRGLQVGGTKSALADRYHASCAAPAAAGPPAAPAAAPATTPAAPAAVPAAVPAAGQGEARNG